MVRWGRSAENISAAGAAPKRAPNGPQTAPQSRVLRARGSMKLFRDNPSNQAGNLIG
jgi:hypothetical protein